MATGWDDPAQNAPGFWVGADDGETIGNMLESFRTYLLMVASQELDPALRPKCGASDVVQETFLQAHRDRASFQGESRHELRLWLREVLLNNIRDVGRFYGQAKRRTEREVSIEAEAPFWLVDKDPTPAARAVSRERADALGDALRGSPSITVARSSCAAGRVAASIQSGKPWGGRPMPRGCSGSRGRALATRAGGRRWNLSTRPTRSIRSWLRGWRPRTAWAHRLLRTTRPPACPRGGGAAAQRDGMPRATPGPLAAAHATRRTAARIR